MFVYRSNRAERLVDALAEVTARPLSDPFAGECIAVAGRGMERWLAMELARRLGVWANSDFPFPRRLIARSFQAVLGGDEAAWAAFDPDTLMWSVAALLPRFLDHPAFAPIRGYLAGDERGVRRLQLAERIARTLDQYVVYRPAMVREWERGADEQWQAVLWRALVERHGSHHTAARAEAFLSALERSDAAPRVLPERVSVFGVSTLPPLYLTILAALSRLVEVHLFLLSPSREYWADVRPERDIHRRLARSGAAAPERAADRHFEVGHPLLASLGLVGRDAQRLLEEAGEYRDAGGDLYADPGTETVLAAIQSDMLALRHRRKGNAAAPPLTLAPDDDSIAIHACHGPMREVEVLHDRLLALFDADPSLQPHDVIVMSPSIDAYAPYVDAVFGGAAGGGRIPYRIADRGVRTTGEVADAFFALIELLRGRLPASEVFDFLGRECVRERFGMGAEDLDVVREWILRSGIRWGADAAHRQEAGQPELKENTWRSGLDRLLLGYAMPGDRRRLYGGVLPHDDVEGSDAEVLGRLVEFSEALFAYRRSLEVARPIARWHDDLGALLGAMLACTSANAYQHRQIHGALEGLVEDASRGGFDEAVDLQVVQGQLAAALERRAPSRGFLMGGVTFCALVPMRSIPFRVVCLLGMNDGDFPRQRRPPDFDLMARDPQPGDRSAREDDRYLFLEALLAARERLVVTYVGQSIRDNARIPPSVVVSELLDAIEEGFVLPVGAAEESVSGRLVITHPLQPFSPRSFAAGDARLFSYARPYFEGACAVRGVRGEVPPFAGGAIEIGPAARREVSIEALERFFKNPARAFAEGIGLHLRDDREEIEDREPLELDNLDQWKMGDHLLRRGAGRQLKEAHAVERASGALPPGVLGDCLFEDIERVAGELAQREAERCTGEGLEPLGVDLSLAGTRLTGVIDCLWPAGHVRRQYSKLGKYHELGVWIRHLVLNCMCTSGYPRESYLVGRSEDDAPATVSFRPVNEPEKILDKLLELYWRGRAEPLPLFQTASRTYVESLRQKGGADAASKAARESYDGRPRHRGDAGDAYVARVFAGVDPLAAFDSGGGQDECPVGFSSVAKAVFGPMLDHREGSK